MDDELKKLRAEAAQLKRETEDIKRAMKAQAEAQQRFRNRVWAIATPLIVSVLIGVGALLFQVKDYLGRVEELPAQSKVAPVKP